MPTGMLNLLDLAKRSNTDMVVGLIEEVSTAAPELTTVLGRTIAGIAYKAAIRKQLPPAQFRNLNEGVAAGKSEYDQKLIECFLVDAQMAVDESMPAQLGLPLETLLSDEAIGAMKSAGILVGSQFYYGKEGKDAKGFPGLQSQVDSSMVVDATGTTSSTGSSVYAIAEGLQGVHLVFGNNGQIEEGEWTRTRILDSSNNPFFAFCNNVKGYVGLNVGHVKSVGRIKKLTEDSGKGLTDALLAKLLAKFPVGMKPTKIFATPRSIEQLRASRTATNATGAPVPTPDNYFGVPIIPTDSISNTESLS